ncbi:chromosome segregation protein SMC [Legionella dresdenensis]|uniref:Chromosome partition protein Smc n=1 Tax=Legionella dresdenensis TaxID=450200 RepID=A0ABV8CFC1_9GAMM
MHLKQLKLAGFKSFVDPTPVPFPSQLVGVVGPNGCGKSNIIDAVRWVMGESSAKNLRGESMTDVIFNGSSNRKAVGQASVELIFDNSLGRLTGQYASYQEISVKRIVTRDGDSSYYLNGTRCRRRDITDIFLGTGAGARGYSIIGQGTISKIVEARPEDLRVYLEEAAGISKYKERRRETLTRIGHTRDNLARIADIRDELDKQLQRLERQARAAEKYQMLKQEEQQCRAEIQALKWQGLNQEQQTLEQQMQEWSVDYEKHQSAVAAGYLQTTELREIIHQESDNYQHLQTGFYQLAAEIARLEENIQQQQREKQRLQQEQQQLQGDWQQLVNQLGQDRETRDESEKRLTSLLHNLEQVEQALKQAQLTCDQAQQQYTAWQADMRVIQANLANANKEIQLEQLKQQHLTQRRQEAMLRAEKIQDELRQLSSDVDDAAIEQLRQCLPGLQAEVQQEENRCQTLLTTAEEQRRQAANTEKLLHQKQDNYHQIKAEQAALSAILAAAKNGQDTEAGKQTQWQSNQRLLDVMTVDSEWQSVCEAIMGNSLQAIVVDDFEQLLPQVETVRHASLQFTIAAKEQVRKVQFPTLADKISGFKPALYPALDSIYTAATLAEAFSWLTQLDCHESIITADGYWLAQGWLRILGDKNDKSASLLVRQQTLKQLNLECEQSKAELEQLKAGRDHLREALEQTAGELNTAKQLLADKQQKLRACETEIAAKERLQQQLQSARTRLLTEQEELNDRLEELAEQQQESEQALNQTSAVREQYAAQENKLNQEKSHWDDLLANYRQKAETVQAECHQMQLQREREQLLMKQTGENIVRDEARLELIRERLETTVELLLTVESPDDSLGNSLNEKLMLHTELEEKIALQREKLDTFNQHLEQKETGARAEEKLARIIQEKLQQAQLQMQALLVRAEGLLESLAELGQDREQLLAMIPPGTTVADRERQLLDIVEKIKRLGAINLAAIEEYDSESERKRHLDAQYHDLNEALLTLEAAIEKMDKETRQRLQQTFDEVNQAFQSLFPRLFGGGRALLELTSDNLLEAGVVVMAQPPGKRNSTIHLLSGGEKAMTAVALVFAIFQLNPSPFCMLDEVDAPLDDVNVGRFCAMVKEMSQHVQFLFITHNKVTMELAEHLIGVTMREPGVSRVVAVDVEQALAMTEA